MTNITDLTGLASSATIIAAAFLLLPAVAGLARNRLAALLALVFVLALIPLNGLSLAAYLRGHIGDLSITTMVMLWGGFLKPWNCCKANSPMQRNTLLAAIAAGAVLLYPMALGWTAYDPYRLGYGDPLFAGILLLVALAAWYRDQRTIALCIALSMLAWTAGWYESGNLWDYLLDPFVAVYAVSVLLASGVKSLWLRLRRRN